MMINVKGARNEDVRTEKSLGLAGGWAAAAAKPPRKLRNEGMRKGGVMGSRLGGGGRMREGVPVLSR